MAKKILIIDDDEEFLSVLRPAIQTAGYEVFTLSDPRKAEESIERYKPDLLIIDVIMPHRSGFNILEDFNDRGVYGDIPKIFLTGLDDDIEKMIARSCGVIEYIIKPFKTDDLLERVKRTIS